MHGLLCTTAFRAILVVNGPIGAKSA